MCSFQRLPPGFEKTNDPAAAIERVAAVARAAGEAVAVLVERIVREAIAVFIHVVAADLGGGELLAHAGAPAAGGVAALRAVVARAVALRERRPGETAPGLSRRALPAGCRAASVRTEHLARLARRRTGRRASAVAEHLA